MGKKKNKSKIVKCKHCGEDIEADKEEFCMKNVEHWKEWWQKFHKNLDMAVAIYLQEEGNKLKSLSGTSIIDFMTYSHKKTGGK